MVAVYKSSARWTQRNLTLFPHVFHCSTVNELRVVFRPALGMARVVHK